MKTNALFTVDKDCFQSGKELATACKNHEQIALEVFKSLKLTNWTNNLLFNYKKFNEEKAKNETKKAIIRELKLELELKKSEIESLTSTIASHATKITSLESDLSQIESVSIQSKQTISSLQETNNELSLKIIELESIVK